MYAFDMIEMLPVLKGPSRNINIEEAIIQYIASQVFKLSLLCTVYYISTDIKVMLDNIWDPQHILREI